MGINEMAQNLLTQEPGRGNRHAEAAGTSEITSGNATCQTHGTDHRETADGYWGELFRIGDYRVAVCRDGIQWMYQRRERTKAGDAGRWLTVGYCRTRAALERLHRENLQPPVPEIAVLPDRFNRKGGAL